MTVQKFRSIEDEQGPSSGVTRTALRALPPTLCPLVGHLAEAVPTWGVQISQSGRSPEGSREIQVNSSSKSRTCWPVKFQQFTVTNQINPGFLLVTS